MIVRSSNVSMASSYRFQCHYSQKQTVQQSFGGLANNLLSSNQPESALPDMGQSPQTFFQNKLDNSPVEPAKDTQLSDFHSVFEGSLVDRLLEIFLGKRRDLLSKLREQLGLDGESQATTWMQTTQTETTVEGQESMNFKATGTVITDEGKSVSFDMGLSMSRNFYEQTNYEVTESGVMLTDPLVIWMNNCPDVIEPQTFSFDINQDGTAEEISSPAKGKGFLALDKNNDGVINDGSELFGTKSGDGFGDLKAYDEDGNGFIDEADSVYSKLKVWTRDSDGNNKLLSLKEADVGAIYLGKSRTQFDLTKKGTQDLDARIRCTGFFLHENGTTGIIQQVDFANQSNLQAVLK